MRGSTSYNTLQVRVSNSFNELIPFVYEVNVVDKIQDGSVTPSEEAPTELDDSMERVGDDAVDFSLVNAWSERQNKKEAKMCFSGSRPKGRHQ